MKNLLKLSTVLSILIATTSFADANSESTPTANSCDSCSHCTMHEKRGDKLSEKKLKPQRESSWKNSLPMAAENRF